MSRRIKIRYTADEITNNLYTIGGELMTTDRQEYIGLYHTYETGEIFSLPKWNARKSQKLIPYKEISDSEQVYQELKPKLQTSYDSIIPLLLEISEQNRIDGYVDRYFLQNIVTKYITEVDNSTFKKLSSRSIDPNAKLLTMPVISILLISNSSTLIFFFIYSCIFLGNKFFIILSFFNI